jgi:hypothetical protein
VPDLRRSRADCNIARSLSSVAFQHRHCAEFVIDAALKHQSLLGCQVQSLDVRVTQLPIQ